MLKKTCRQTRTGLLTDFKFKKLVHSGADINLHGSHSFLYEG